MVTIRGNEYNHLSSNPDEAICISHNANNLMKGMNMVKVWKLWVNSKADLSLLPS